MSELPPSTLRVIVSRPNIQLRAVVEEAGASLQKVVKTTVFLKNVSVSLSIQAMAAVISKYYAQMSDFAAINKIYEAHFEGHKPARSCVAVRNSHSDLLDPTDMQQQVAELPKGCLFEIEAIVSLK